MRILLRTERDERGAVAVFSAILCVVLVGIAAFTVDFGTAYISKRQLQTAADAGALAAAAAFANYNGACGTLAANTDAIKDAQKAADSMREQNRPGSVGETVKPQCDATNKSLNVTYSASASTQTVLGGILGTSQVAATRTATANLSVPNGATGLRPYVICSTYVPTTALPSAVVKVDFPKKSVDTGTCPSPGGNWFTLDCPHPGKSQNGNPGLALATRDGCDHEVKPVAPLDSTSPKKLGDSLNAGCPANVNAMQDYDPDCLSANPGNVGSGNLNDDTSVDGAWQTLVGKKVLFPVFCALPTCDPIGYVGDKSGNNSMYPVWKMAGAKVCGWHWGSQDSGKYNDKFPTADSTDLCYGADASVGDPNDNYLLLAFTVLLTSGTTDASMCALADISCDGGARRVLLTN